MSKESERISSKRAEREEAEVVDSTTSAEQSQAIADDVDDILDEIDATLEENAAAFVAAFVQKGGE